MNWNVSPIEKKLQPFSLISESLTPATVGALFIEKRVEFEFYS
jgi:hypothetical protein